MPIVVMDGKNLELEVNWFPNLRFSIAVDWDLVTSQIPRTTLLSSQS